MLNVLPSALRVSSRAAAIAAKQSGRPAILQQRPDRDRTGPELGPDRAGLCSQELSGPLILRFLINVFNNPQQESREVGGGGGGSSSSRPEEASERMRIRRKTSRSDAKRGEDDGRAISQYQVFFCLTGSLGPKP